MSDAAFFNVVRERLFDGSMTQKQVDAINTIIAAWDKWGDSLPGEELRLAYVLATAYHETARFKHMREIWGPTAAQKRYEGRSDLGNAQAGDGKKFMGRGFVQITGRRNYSDWSRRLGLDLLKEPQLAERPDIAARILVQGMVLGTFTTRKLGDYVKEERPDFVEARRVVNGTDRAGTIADYAQIFVDAFAAAAKEPAPQSKPAPSIWGAILAFIKAIFGRK